MPEFRPSKPASEDGLPLMLCQIEALQLFARTHGRSWKSRLRTEWSNATADPLLHRLRNTHGPRWLECYRLPTAVPTEKRAVHHR